MLQKMCSDFAITHLVPHAATFDAKHEFPADAVKKLGELGMMGVVVDPEFGGSGMDSISYAIAIEEISKGCASTGTYPFILNPNPLPPFTFCSRASTAQTTL